MLLVAIFVYQNKHVVSALHEEVQDLNAFALPIINKFTNT